MPVHYRISPELGVALIFCNGVVSDKEYLKAVTNMYSDIFYESGMHHIVDFFSAVEDVSLEGMRSLIKHREEMEAKGTEFGHVTLLTHSKSLFLLIKTMRLLVPNAEMKLDSAASLNEAIALLNLQHKKQDVVDFYICSKHQLEMAGCAIN